MVIEINSTLIDTPELVNEDPYGEAWMAKIEISDPVELEALMDAAPHEEYRQERGT
jgi:glycine cleavage system H protein